MTTLRAFILCVLAALSLAPAAAVACTRALYHGGGNITLTGRTMDWLEDIHSDLWVFPRGLARDGAAGPSSFTWTSKYGSVVVCGYNAGTCDGMNEKGLVANLLFLAESEYPAPDDPRPPLSIAAWAQWVLDSFATVEEAVAAMEHAPYRIVAPTLPNGMDSTLHLSISDASGDSAIVQYIGGKPNIHHSRDYQVMTNSPVFDQQLALNAYWQQIGGTTMLPGANRAADRFVRACFYINACEQTDDPRAAAAAVLSVMRNVSVPRGITTPDQPNISSTIWLTVADQTNRVYYFHDTLAPGAVWVRLADIDFAESSGTRRLALSADRDLAGNQTGAFVLAEPFPFLPGAPR